MTGSAGPAAPGRSRICRTFRRAGQRFLQFYSRKGLEMGLSIGRKVGEKIRVRTTYPECGSIVITLSRSRKGGAVISVDAPRDMHITREAADGSVQTRHGGSDTRTEPCVL